MGEKKDKLIEAAKIGAEFGLTTGAAFYALNEWAMGAGLERLAGIERAPFTVEDIPMILAANAGLIAAEKCARAVGNKVACYATGEDIPIDLDALTQAELELGIFEEL